MSARMDWLPGFVTWFKSFLAVWSTGVVLFSGAGAFLWWLGENELRDWAHEFMGIPSLATAAQVAELQASIAELRGLNGVIQTKTSASFVFEPVSVGALVKARLVLRRTPDRAGCVTVSGTPMFADVSDIPTPGILVSGVRQISTEWTRLNVVMRPPPDLLPGRVVVFVSIEYDCAGQTEFDETAPLIFKLLPA